MNKASVSILASATAVVFAVAGAMVLSSTSAEAAAETSNPKIVKRESWTTNYIAKAGTSTVPDLKASMTYAIVVYSDGTINVIGQNTTKPDSWVRTANFGTIWYDDSVYNKFEFNYKYQEGSYLNTITNYDAEKIGYDFTWSTWERITIGKIFEFTLHPCKGYSGTTTLELFGHEVEVNVDNSTEATTAPNSEANKDLKKFGDIDGDGTINAKDAALLLRYTFVYSNFRTKRRSPKFQSYNLTMNPIGLCNASEVYQ